MLRVVACGSVDDGKSTLIGRLVHDAGGLPDDERAALIRTSRQAGSRDGAIDYALLLDGLEAEREQGITIDVAWRHLVTPRRRLLIADCPGHVQYTRNMATGASVSSVAILLVDATRGLVPQTFRHSVLLALFGIRHVLLAINKMDRVDFAQTVFEDLAAAYREHAGRLGIPAVTCIPVVAVDGDNVLTASPRMPWYTGPTLLGFLETVDVTPRAAAGRACLPVQGIVRDGQGQRWLTGTLASGELAIGDPVQVQPGGPTTTVRGLSLAGAPADAARSGQAIAVRLAEEVDAARGHVLVSAGSPLAVADQFVADLAWFAETPLLPGRRYRLACGSARTGARVMEIKHRHDPESLKPLAATRLETNQTGQVVLSLDAPIAFAPYTENASLGSLVLVDPASHATLAAGMIRHGLRRAQNIQWQALDVDRRLRASLKGQQPRCVWFTGLSGSGKSTIANLVERELAERGLHTYLLDGDNVRHGLNRDLGFTDEDRVENLRRIAEVARLMTDAGLIVLVSFISPFRAERRAARQLFGDDEFIEVFVDTPLAEAERRDPKGLYAKARAGRLPNFTGIDSPYEPPEDAEIRLETLATPAAELARRVVAYLLAD